MITVPQHITNISIGEYDYHLPDEQVARYPLEQRDASKLLVWNNGTITNEQFSNLHNYLPPQAMLVFNNTRVIRARLHFTKNTGAKIEIFLLDPIAPADYAQNFQQTRQCTWKCLVGNQKKWKTDELHLPLTIGKQHVVLTASDNGSYGNGKAITFNWDNAGFSFSEIIEAAGNIPIPPYLNRESDENDLTRYQTVYSKVKGSVAAPTAGLHFTDQVFATLHQTGFTTTELTLHVGAGTFQPVKSDTIGEHPMHTEHFVVNRSLVERILHCENPVIAVGTTSVRTLESIYWLGCKVKRNPTLELAELNVGQWEPYTTEEEYSVTEACNALRNYMHQLDVDEIQASTQIIIVPGYTFRITEGMITNFHQPQSTLLLLVSAFVGNQWKTIYNHALANNYRFLSYGDSNLYLRG